MKKKRSEVILMVGDIETIIGFIMDVAFIMAEVLNRTIQNQLDITRSLPIKVIQMINLSMQKLFLSFRNQLETTVVLLNRGTHEMGRQYQQPFCL